MTSILKIVFILLFAASCETSAQTINILSPRIASLQVVAGQNWLAMPIIPLVTASDVSTTDPINISFDDLTHEYHRYVYKLEHCEADWSVSTGIFDSDYCEGFSDGNLIEDIQESINTNTLYTHYHLAIPNDNCRIKLSGNYRVTIYDENTSDTILTAHFMVVDPKANISLVATSNTDIDTNKSHQQLTMRLDYGLLNIKDPQREIRSVVLQNGYWHNARHNTTPSHVRPDGLQWEHNKQLIFDAGNEYHKFEILDVTHPTLGIENVWWDGSYYHAQIWTDMPRPNYVYDEDANGAFYIRNSDNIENDRISEYVNVHFRLSAPQQHESIYIDGVWTNHLLDSHYEMVYNHLDKQYEATITLKQGYYSYRYISVDADGNISNPSSEGNFFQTENKYQALVYYRGIGERTDQLVAYRELIFK